MNITFRTQLLGSVTDFCRETGLAMATPEVLVDLIVRLARYREEGMKLSPQVYLTDDIDLLVNMLPEGEKLPLSDTTADPHGIEEMLKICAPLAVGEWRIFGHQCAQGMNFGVFRGSGNPISVGVDEIVLTDQDKAAVIKAHQVAEECVQIFNSNGLRHHVFFNHRKEESPPPLQHIENLVRSITKHVDDNEREAVQSFLTRILMTALLNSHGCILAVTNMRTPPKVLSNDAVILDEPIDFPSMTRELKNGGSAGRSPYSLEKKAELLEGMLRSDGITMFDQRGRLLGYRCFIRISGERGVVGGARRRAFESLKRRLGRGLSAAFMQSQDGWTEFEEYLQ